jgi:hypothetical protein
MNDDRTNLINESGNLQSRLLDEARRLFQSLLQEIMTDRWAEYQEYLQSYHTLVLRSYQAGFSQEIIPIRPVSPDDIGPVGNPSPLEKEGLLEILKRTWILCNTLENVLVSGAFPKLAYGDIKSAISRVENICDKFHIVSTLLKRSYQGKRGFPIRDEYDVQRLFRALLTVDFEDVQSEDHVPSHAGGPSRMDFLIMPYEIAVETKMTRKNLKDKQLGEELLVDIAKYKKHPNCKALVCFIYDPNGLIENSAGLARGLEESGSEDFTVRVVIKP